MSTDITKTNQDTPLFKFEIKSLDEAIKLAERFATSDFAPREYKNKPENVLIAMQYGAELGLKPLAAIQNISVINGRPAVWGDALLAVVLSSPVCEFIHEHAENGVAYCTVKRRGEEKEYTYKFSVDDAKKAGLFNKSGTWSQYPQRMLQMRARGFALRDKFADLLKGIQMLEEVQDYQVEKSTNNKTEAVQILEAIIEKNEVAELHTVASIKSAIENAQNTNELKEIGKTILTFSDDDRKELRPIYVKKSKNLSVNKETGELQLESTKLLNE